MLIRYIANAQNTTPSKAIDEDLHNRNVDTVSDGNFKKRITLPSNAPNMSRAQLWEKLIADGNLIAVGPKGKSQATVRQHTRNGRTTGYIDGVCS